MILSEGTKVIAERVMECGAVVPHQNPENGQRCFFQATKPEWDRLFPIYGRSLFEGTLWMGSANTAVNTNGMDRFRGAVWLPLTVGNSAVVNWSSSAACTFVHSFLGIASVGQHLQVPASGQSQ